jgi:hypothetical protein
MDENYLPVVVGAAATLQPSAAGWAAIWRGRVGPDAKECQVGQDRLPNTLSKSVGVRSREVGAVCDLELRPRPVLCGRS